MPPRSCQPEELLPFGPNLCLIIFVGNVGPFVAAKSLQFSGTRQCASCVYVPIAACMELILVLKGVTKRVAHTAPVQQCSSPPCSTKRPHAAFPPTQPAPGP